MADLATAATVKGPPLTVEQRLEYARQARENPLVRAALGGLQADAILALTASTYDPIKLQLAWCQMQAAMAVAQRISGALDTPATPADKVKS